MPVTAIPFKSPPPFEIPPPMAAPIRTAPPAQAAQQALALLAQVDAGDAMAVAWLDAAGRLGHGAWEATGPAAPALAAMDAARKAAPAPVAADGDFMARAVAEGRALLYMGEVAAADAGPFPAPFRDWLVGGAPAASVGFLYVYPILDPAGSPRGALMIHRGLADGPLNHDQPAIAHALAGLLGEAAAAG